MDSDFHGTRVDPPPISQWQPWLTWPELEEEAGQGCLFKREGFPRAWKWSSASGLCVGQPSARPWLVLEQCSPVVTVVMDMLYLYTVQYGRHQPHLAAEHLNVASAAEEGRNFLYYPLLVN